jgi:fatty acid kinase fatty acid binding subunit
MVRAKESPAKWGYFFVLNMRKLHKGIVKGNRVRVNVQCSALFQEKKGTIESRLVKGCAMPSLAVVTDSTASIPEPMLKELNIHVVAYYIHRGKEVLRDLVTIQRDEFLCWLPTATSLPTTASPGPGDYLEMYKSLIGEGVRSILSIHMTSKGSGAYQAATVAQSMLQEEYRDIRVEVVDTQNVSLCQGWVAIEAARMVLAGLSLDDVLASVKRMLPIIQMIQTADTLKFLYMGGRIGMAKRLVGTLLNIKPLIGMKNGVILALGQARSRVQAYSTMADMVGETVGKGKVKVAYVHAGALEEARKIKELVENKVEVVESFFAELSPALAVHTGPGTAGLCFYPVDK